ncbi:MAG: hypothetical protein DRP45_03385 [Candidatus Zixiibacteriota bacterium]|nr:MAG: hypothetical protein DRP45_03385 [candidate division Zixibacteria bacterium]
MEAMIMMYKKLRNLLILLAAIMVAGSASAQSDEYGALDAVYIDSVEAGPGEDVPVKFNVLNDETLSFVSIPVVYDPEILTLKSISFADSRAEYFNTKLHTPNDISEINGHFVVALIQIFEDPIPVGDGLMFTALFEVSASAVAGTVAIIDSLFYPPGGELLLVETSSSGQIRPRFEAGRVVIGADNRAPEFAITPDVYVLEGDSLDLSVIVIDPDQDDLTVATTAKPSGAVFVDNGDGTARISWLPNFVGPNSADGSPFTVGFWASDGDLSCEQQLLVNVINNNRPPIITAPESVGVEAGELLEFSVSAIDPDFEDVVWTVTGLPEGATFDGGNPGQFLWQTSLTDSGSFNIEVISTDPHGLADTINIDCAIQAVAHYALSLDTVEAFPNEDVVFNLMLDNKFPVASFNILFNYDPSALSLLSLTNEDTRAASFEYYVVRDNENGVAGDVRILGIADMSGAGALEPGDGPIGLCRLHTSGNLAFAGMSIPVHFRFHDAPTNDDNTLTDSIGNKIDQEDIEYSNGYVAIHDMEDITIGDINLNGLAAEIGDVIYFTNHFINPFLYSFNALQYANSDVNQDNLAATISDLVALINWVVSGSPVAKSAGTAELSAMVLTEQDHETMILSCDADFDMGAALVVLEANADLDNVVIHNLRSDMTLDCRQDENALRILLYSLEGNTVPSGVNELFSIECVENLEITQIEMGSADGKPVLVHRTEAGGSLPSGYALEQNYPNPFNPETEISFSLPVSGHARLDVYNIAGRKVATLVDEQLEAGHHSVTWDGRNHSGLAVSSGIYLYRLQAGEFGETRKMMLLK